MNRLTYILTALILAILLASYSLADKSVQLYDIPPQTINLFKILGNDSKGKEQLMNGYQISGLVTYKEYKEYLSAIKKDSSKTYYQTQLPDSNIGSTEVRNKYINSSAYDDLPVLGISWDNAMNFCKWKTLKENKDSIQIIYRLPDCSEWLAAYFYLSENKIKNDFNKNYSDWLLNSKVETYSSFRNDMNDEFPFNYIYFHKKNDPLVLKRKIVIGDSYLFQQDKLINYNSFSFYATEGYRQVSFRYIKDSINQSETVYDKRKKIAGAVLEFWGIRAK